MSEELTPFEEKISPEKLQEIQLKEIYREGFEVGARDGKQGENPYAFHKGDNPKIAYSLVFSVQWEQGRADGKDTSNDFSNLSPYLLEKKRGYLKSELDILKKKRES